MSQSVCYIINIYIFIYVCTCMCKHSILCYTHKHKTTTTQRCTTTTMTTTMTARPRPRLRPRRPKRFFRKVYMDHQKQGIPRYAYMNFLNQVPSASGNFDPSQLNSQPDRCSHRNFSHMLLTRLQIFMLCTICSKNHRSKIPKYKSTQQVTIRLIVAC